MDGTLYIVGSEVYWNDPDEGIASRYDTIEKVTSYFVDLASEGEVPSGADSK